MTSPRSPGRATRALEAIFQDAALLAAEQRGDLDAPEMWAESLATSLRTEIARRRQQSLPDPPSAPHRLKVPSRLYAMSRAALEARISALLQLAGPDVQLAYRNLETRTESDLRILVALLEQGDGEATP